MTQEELFQEYETAQNKIDEEAHNASELARAKLRAGLKALREAHHTELKAIRHIDQKVKRSNKNAG